MKKFYKLSNKSFSQFKVKNYKQLWDKVKSEGYDALEIDCITLMEKSEDKPSMFNFVFSTAKEDRHGDIVEQNWDLKSFKKNPVFLDSHNYSGIEHVLGKITGIKVSDNKLRGKVEFAVDANPKAEMAMRLVEGGFLHATSVGFIPLEFDKDYTILKSELLEVSLVSVPANPEALLEKLYAKNKSKNIDDEQDEDDDEEDAESEDNNGGETGRGENNDEDGEDGGDEEVKKYESIKKEFENWDNGDKEIRFKLKDIALFEVGTLRKVTLIETYPRIFANVGKLKGDDSGKEYVQCLFFPKEEGWTEDDARKWFTLEQYRLLANPEKPGEQEKAPALNADGSIPIKSAKGKYANVLKGAFVADGKVYFINKNKQKDILSNLTRVLEQSAAEKKDETRRQSEVSAKKAALNRAMRAMVKAKKKL